MSEVVNYIAAIQLMVGENGIEPYGAVHLVRAVGKAQGGVEVAQQEIVCMCGKVRPFTVEQAAAYNAAHPELKKEKVPTLMRLWAFEPGTIDAERTCKICGPAAKANPQYVAKAPIGYEAQVGEPKRASERPPGIPLRRTKGAGTAALRKQLAEKDAELLDRIARLEFADSQLERAELVMGELDDQLEAWGAWADKVDKVLGERPNRQVTG